MDFLGRGNRIEFVGKLRVSELEIEDLVGGRKE